MLLRNAKLLRNDESQKLILLPAAVKGHLVIKKWEKVIHKESKDYQLLRNTDLSAMDLSQAKSQVNK